MRNFRTHLPSVSLVSICLGAIGICAVVYIGLIATVMTSATVTIGFSQSMKNDEAVVAELEAKYLASIATIQTIDYHLAGYVVPSTQIFVPTESVTALR